MARYTSGQNPPLGNWNGLPIYLTTIFTAALVLGLAVSAILLSMQSPLFQALIFSMPLKPWWSLWRLFTYVFIGHISFFTPFSILFFYWMSVGIETHLGRRVVSTLWILLALTVPAVAALWYWILGVSWSTEAYDNYLFSCGLLIAFATLYPTTEAWGWIPFKWIAFACIVCGSLMILAQRDWVGLSMLWVSCAVGFAYIRHAKELEYDDYESPLQRLSFWFKRRKFKVVKAPSGGSARPAVSSAGTDPQSEVDRLLDKIAKSGLASLSAKERSQLKKASEELSRRDEP